ncbi:F-box protein At3g56470-like [Asparagus officinalis]|uniref:F-box protein At3g56470-like n=1 Tax=Asparagus officinalis TaxID=4686 RepID=UPI00098E4F02|nr:F-box protein At3g56470-like [Asparagus officinalis]
MPLDILEQISDRLPLVDYVRFRGACKHWRSSPSARAELVNFSKDRPWAMFYGLQRDETRIPECYVYSKSHPHRCTIMLHDLEGATVVKSKHGWLLAHRDLMTMKTTISDPNIGLAIKDGAQRRYLMQAAILLIRSQRSLLAT